MIKIYIFTNKKLYKALFLEPFFLERAKRSGAAVSSDAAGVEPRLRPGEVQLNVGNV